MFESVMEFPLKWSRDVPETLYHYCSIDTFFSIFQKGSIWLSDIRKSNDSDELLYVGKECSNIWTYSRDEHLSKWAEREQWNKEQLYDYPVAEGYCLNFLAFKSPYELSESVYKTYVFCLSELRDKLSQWRGYADNGAGICIGFKSKYFSSLNDICHNPFNELRVMFNNVRYDAQDLSDLIEAYLDYDEEKLPALEDYTRKLFLAAVYAYVIAPFWKQPSFSEEMEWRVALTLEMDSLDGTPKYKKDYTEHTFGDVEFNVINGVLKSHVELFFNHFKDAVSEIIIGPKCTATEYDIKMFLVSKGLLKNFQDDSIIVVKSESSYR